MKQFLANLLLKFALKHKKLTTRYAAKWLRYIIENNVSELDPVLMKAGLYPLLDTYYNPMVNPKKHLYKSLREDRLLPGINFNIDEQIALCKQFNYNKELLKFPLEKNKEAEFHYNNGSFNSGDAEYFYNTIRYFKPKQIIEIGSGSSTLMAINAIKANRKEDTNYQCKHLCIEPYEQPFLETLNVELIRKRVELLDHSTFAELNENDILFIDSSHIIRPQGDVLFEYLEILPQLSSGVIVHIHDIFTPKDYLNEWVYNHVLWNEQYLLEAFISLNKEYKIIGALNYLSHNHKKVLEDVCPILASQDNREPGSFWIQKI